MLIVNFVLNVYWMQNCSFIFVYAQNYLHPWKKKCFPPLHEFQIVSSIQKGLNELAGVSKWSGTRYFYPSEIVYSTGKNYWTPENLRWSKPQVRLACGIFFIKKLMITSIAEFSHSNFESWRDIPNFKNNFTLES